MSEDADGLPGAVLMRCGVAVGITVAPEAAKVKSEEWLIRHRAEYPCGIRNRENRALVHERIEHSRGSVVQCAVALEVDLLGTPVAVDG